MVRALSKEKMSLIILVLLISTVAFYYHIYNVRYTCHDVKSSEERCEADLETTRYQLAAVTDYKDKIEKLLTETKKLYDADRLRFHDVLDSFVSIRNQVITCQVSMTSKNVISQFNDLMADAKAVKQQLDSENTLKYPEKIQTGG